MTKNQKNDTCLDHQKHLDFIGRMLREMRLGEGRNQDGFVTEGISRRLIQRAEYGNNISVIKLLSLLKCYGYTLKDLEFDD